MEPTFVKESIRLISKDNISINFEDDELLVNLLTKNSPKRANDAIKLIVAYFTEDLEYLKKTCGSSFRDLKQQIKILTYGNEKLEKHRNTTNAKMKLYQDPRIKFIAREELVKFGLDKTNTQMIRIIHEVSPAPKSREEMVENLRLAINKPNNILSTSLSIFDCNIGQLPPQWSKIAVFKKLKRQIALENNFNDDKTEANIALLKEALSFYKNISVVPLSIIVSLEDTPENGAMKLNLMHSLKGKIPVLTTQQLIYEILNNQIYWKILDQLLSHEAGYTLYAQKQGNLVLILPPSHFPVDAGINPHEFDKVEKSLCEKFSKNPGKGSFDLTSIFIKETEDQRFSRPIAWFGHGSSSISKKEQGHIAGLSIPDFQANWDILSENGLEFLFLSSCFVGGENMSHVTSSSGTVTCPVIIKSSSDISSYTSLDMTMHLALQLAAIKLYPTGEGLNHKARPLKQIDLKEIGSLALSDNFYKENGKLMNMQSFILPSYNADIPHAAYSGSICLQAMDIDEEFKQLKIHHGIEHKGIVDKSEDRQLYFFSQPVAPITLINESIQAGRVGLASRGGDNFHIIDGLELPHIQLKAIIDKTLTNRAHDATGEKKRKESGANKLFAIQKMRCKVNEKCMLLENVIIAATDKGPFIACKAPYDRYYVINSFEDLDRMNFTPVSADEFCQSFYPIALACAPNIEQLKINTAGRQGANDFFGRLQKLFWNDQLPLTAELYEAIIQKRPELVVVHLKNKIYEKCNREKRHQLILNGVIIAIKTNNLRAFEDLMASHLKVDAQDDNGVPLFHYAVQSGNKEIVQYFLKYGVDPKIENLSKITAYELASHNLPIFKLLIEGRRLEEWNIPFSCGMAPLGHALATLNEPLLNFLIDKKIHLYTHFKDNTPLLYLTIMMGHKGFVKLLIAKGFCLDDKFRGLPLIFHTIKTGNAEIVKLFVENGVNLNVKDLENFSPLQRALKQNNEEIENIILFGNEKLHSTSRNRLINPKELPSNYVSVAKDYMNFLISIDEKGTGIQPNREMENKFFKVLRMQSNLSDFIELAESGYIFSQEFYQEILNVILNKPTYFQNSLCILDYGFAPSQQQCNQWILKLIKLGRVDIIKGLDERSYSLQHMSPLQEEILVEILMDLPKEQLVSSLISAAAAGLNVRRLSENSKIKICMAVSGTLKDQPKAIALFDKILHLELLKEKLFV
ncbi:MAG: ankyrin repeat domain-containing protein [Candidatus Protochlamydia sp.]|nr:ankyrin repeat domain-containing protein [Candidatus Protochlamydia sp.]